LNLFNWTRSARTPEEAWSRNLTILLTAIFIEEIGWSLTAPFLPLYIRELGIPDPKKAALWAGLVMAASLAISSAMTPVWAALADRFGSKLILLRALAALAVTNFAVGLVGDVQQILMVRLASALFTGLVPLSYAIITSSAPQVTLAQSVARLQTVTIVAASLSMRCCIWRRFSSQGRSSAGAPTRTGVASGGGVETYPESRERSVRAALPCRDRTTKGTRRRLAARTSLADFR